MGGLLEVLSRSELSPSCLRPHSVKNPLNSSSSSSAAVQSGMSSSGTVLLAEYRSSPGMLYPLSLLLPPLPGSLASFFADDSCSAIFAASAALTRRNVIFLVRTKPRRISAFRICTSTTRESGLVHAKELRSIPGGYLVRGMNLKYSPPSPFELHGSRHKPLPCTRCYQPASKLDEPSKPAMKHFVQYLSINGNRLACRAPYPQIWLPFKINQDMNSGLRCRNQVFATAVSPCVVYSLA